MKATMKTVFVSSTSTDLTEHRKAVRDAIIGLGMHPIMMEDFGAVDANAVDFCHQKVDECDIFVGIYAHRYGYVPEGETKSITEMEYDWASDGNKPRLIFVVDLSYGWNESLKEADEAQQDRLKAFKNRLGHGHVWANFTTPEVLATRVLIGLSPFRNDSKSGDPQIISPAPPPNHIPWPLIILVIAILLGLGGFLGYQNFFANRTDQATPTVQPTTVISSESASPEAITGSSPVPTAITSGTNREVLILLTKFDQVAGSNEDPAAAWERTLQKPISELKLRVRVDRYDKVVKTAEEAKTIARQYHATIVIWGWTYKDVSLTTEYTVEPQWSEVQTTVGEVQSFAAPTEPISVTIAKGADTEYVLNFVLGQLEYFGTTKREAIPYFERCIALAQTTTPEQQRVLGIQAVYFYSAWLKQNIEKDLDEALKLYGIVLKFDAKDSYTYNNRGNVYYDLKRYEEALADFNKVIELNPKLAIAYNNRGNVYYDLKRYEEALTDYDQALKLDPDLAAAYSGKGTVYSDQKRNDDALKAFNKALQVDPNYVNAYYNRALLFKAMDRNNEAMTDYTQALKLDPTLAAAYNGRGVLYYGLKQFNEALSDFDQAIKFNPTSVDAYYNRGNVNYDLGQLEQAISDYSQALKLDPTLLDAYYNRGNAHYDLKHYENSIADYTQAIQLDQTSATGYYNRGNVYSTLGRKDEAIADYTQAIKIKPDLASAYYNRGVVYSDLERLDEAMADYSKAIELDPKSAKAYYNRGVLYSKQKRYNEALSDYSSAISFDSSFAKAYFNRGVANVNLKHFEDALADYTAAIKFDPTIADAYFNRGLLYQRNKLYREALKDFQDYVKLMPDDPEGTVKVKELEPLAGK